MSSWDVGEPIAPLGVGAPSVLRVGRKVDVDDLVDAHDVAQILGLSSPTSVYLYPAALSRHAKTRL